MPSAWSVGVELHSVWSDTILYYTIHDGRGILSSHHLYSLVISIHLSIYLSIIPE